MTIRKLGHKGNAAKTVAIAGIGGSTADLTFTLDDPTGWPTGANDRLFYAVFRKDTVYEEKVLCVSRTDSTVTIYDAGGYNGRAQDDTSITSHPANCAVEHCGTAEEFQQLNDHLLTGTGVHLLTGDVVGTTDTQELTNKILIAPVIADFTNAAHDHGDANDGGGLVTPTLTGPIETAIGSATAATGTINFDVVTQSILEYTSDASANWTLNVRGSASVSLDTLLAVNQSVTIVFLVTQGTTAYYQSAMTIDGNAVTPKWQGGTAPTAGNVSGVDAYTITIRKTASATFRVFAAQTRFA